ncbi:MAG: hypothetical protein BWY47_02167 [Bacteroidetes bacterium ADurb.Bin302]|nr:MAG: hypothetical protein BWY47_02167 [Bacteroidetes bacterium ADurb.Bin302]
MQNFLNDMQQTPSILSSLSVSSPSYQSFYDSLDLSNIGTFAKINVLMNEENYANAEISNVAIIPTNNIEKNICII